VASSAGSLNASATRDLRSPPPCVWGVHRFGQARNRGRPRPMRSVERPDVLFGLSGIRCAGSTRTSRIQRIRELREGELGRFLPRIGGVGVRHASGSYVPDARPLHYEAARDRSDRFSTHGIRRLRFEDSPGAAPVGSARKLNRNSDHSSEQERQREQIPRHRTGRKRSNQIRRVDQSSFVAVDRRAVFVAWHFLWERFKDLLCCQ
jgi:hypothetical protein